jgi:hypothetical protein
MPNIGEPYTAMEYAKQLAAKYGCGRRFDPVECWAVIEDQPQHVQVTMVRGSCDYRESDYSYAEIATTTDSYHTISSRYLFPSTHNKPVVTEFTDNFGKFHDWAAQPRKQRKH